MDRRALVHPHAGELVEVALLHLAAGIGDLAVHRVPQAPDHAALHQVLEVHRVQHRADVGRGPDLLDADAGRAVADLHHQPHRHAEGVDQRHAAPLAGCRARAVPLAHPAQGFQHLARLRVAGQADALVQRVGAGGVDQLVQKALAEEARAGGADRSPRAGGRQRRHAVGAHAAGGQGVGHVPDAGGDLRVRPRHLQAHAAHLRFGARDGGDVDGQRLHLAATHGAAPARHADLAREVVRKILLAAEGELDRHARHLARDLGRQRHVLEFQPVAEAAAGELVVQVHLLVRAPADGGHLLLRHARELAGGPHVHPALRDLDDGRQRLQRRVRQIGRAVLGLQRLLAQRGLHVAVVAPQLVESLLGEGIGDRLPVGGLLGRVAGWHPVAADGLGRLEGTPGVVGHHGHAAGHRHDLLHAAHGFGRLGVKAAQRRAVVGVEPNRGVQHAFQLLVDAVAQRAGGFGHDVQPLHRLAEQAPLAGVAQGHVLHRIQFGGGRGELRIGDLLAVRQQHGAAGGLQLRHRHAALLGGGGLQRLARHGAGAAQLVEAVGHGAGAAGGLHADQLHHRAGGVARGLGDPAVVGGAEGHGVIAQRSVVVGSGGHAGRDGALRRVHVQLFGDQRGLQRTHALAQVGMGGDQGNALRVDQHPGVEGSGAFRGAVLQRVVRGLFDLPDAEGHAAGDGGRADQEGAAGDGAQLAHVSPPASGFGPPASRRRGCAGRCRSGTGWRPWRRRCPGRSGRGWPAGRRLPS